MIFLRTLLLLGFMTSAFALGEHSRGGQGGGQGGFGQGGYLWTAASRNMRSGCIEQLSTDHRLDP